MGRVFGHPVPTVSLRSVDHTAPGVENYVPALVSSYDLSAATDRLATPKDMTGQSSIFISTSIGLDSHMTDKKSRTFTECTQCSVILDVYPQRPLQSGPKFSHNRPDSRDLGRELYYFPS